ncbi:MAG: 2-phospho-L-lactate transferase [Candidatus Rokubacteria bacterium]|nr:2-phospho-L-lactate transferase [Candidatus Rokubacteria bacterium]
MIVALAGGTGAAKFLRGLVAVVPPEQVAVIVNTGDDALVWGLHVSPDLDTVTYALAGLLDEAKGWGVRDDTFRCLAAMAALGRETWFNLGDRDLGTHLFRTERLAAGRSLTEVTEAIRRALGVRSRLLPASDSPVATRVLTPGGWLGFQEYFVREKARVEVLDVAYGGAETASPAPGVLEAIHAATAVVICPSNPITSIGPILAVPGIAEALASTPARVLAISPIVGGAPVSGPAGKLMAAKGLPVSALGVAQLYRPWLDVLALDRQDERLAPDVAALGIAPLVTGTLMTDRRAEAALARAVVDRLAS